MNDRIKELAGLWYDGQWSYLYKLTSTSYPWWNDVDILDGALHEIEMLLKFHSVKDKKELKRLYSLIKSVKG